MERNDIKTIAITDIGSKGEGIGRVENFVVFVDNCLPGDICEIKILKMKKSYAYGKLVKVITPSVHRVQSPCAVSDKCGGCAFLHMDYEAQLKLKENKVRESLKRLGGFDDVNMLPIEPMNTPKAYRNKAQIPVRQESGRIKIGYYAKNSHRVIENEGCYIQTDIVEEVVGIVRDYMIENGVTAYDEEKMLGMVRHIVVRSAFGTGEVMVVLVLNAKYKTMPKNHARLIESLAQIDGMKSICFNYNNESTNVVMGEKNEFVWGDEYIIDRLGEFGIKISPHSFYQINPAQTLKIYEYARDFAEISKDDVVIDAYCGTGTIGLFFAKAAARVYGIESSPYAVNDAILTAEVNGANNIEFILGKAEEKIYEFVNKDIQVDIVVVDPPRKGCDMKFLEAVVKLQPKKIAYISCNPDTLARDLKFLAEYGYEIRLLKSFDMFCHTVHVECVVLLQRKEHAELLDFKHFASHVTFEDEGEKARNKVLICKSKHRTRVEYTLKTSNAPIGVATYSTQDILPDNLRALLPSPDELARIVGAFDDDAVGSLGLGINDGDISEE